MTPTPSLSDTGNDWVAAAIETHFGLQGTLRRLVGDRDSNFLLSTAQGDHWVVKVTAIEEPDETFDFECRLMTWLGEESSAPIPSLLRTRQGGVVARVEDGGIQRRVRILEFLPGQALGDVRPRTPNLLRALGRTVAGLDLDLARFPELPADRDDTRWTLGEAGRVIESGLDAFHGRRRALMEDALARHQAALPLTQDMERQTIHGDVNDYNVLVSPVGPGPRVITGILDFGDLNQAPAVFDLAIAMAYGALDVRDPVRAAASIAAGYHEVRPLSEDELAVAHSLMVARLAVSVTVSASRRHESEEVDEYHIVSEAPAWAALEAMADVHPHLARGILRDACGLPACPRAAALTGWMAEQDFAPVMDMDPGRTTVLDLSVGSPHLTGRDTDDTAAFTERTWAGMREANATVGIGRYDEPRGFYLTEAFAGRDGEPPERRTIHIGIDVFDEPGAEVRAFMPSVVRSVQVNEGRLDYGPTVILEHESPEGPFWTLYGHLKATSVTDLAVGQSLAAGEAFAQVGPYPENGDWPPHLHLQIITDLLGNEGEFAGVALPRERSVWTSFSPDPNLILKLPLDTTYRDPAGLLERRERVLGRSLSLSYDAPIHAVRGVGAYLYDDAGREYLDCVNNVAHVGHEHPHVVRAAQRQMAILNTNTRYLHENVLAYAERLGALFPDPLSVCFFVNSGSEANELALRMARAHSGGSGIVALEGGYHGNTQGLVDVSHYKFAGPGGSGPPPWVRAAAMPDAYRGRYSGEPDAAVRYADHLAQALEDLESAGHPPAAFLAEAILSCGGQIVPPEGYFEATYSHVRAAGAVSIADEVQVGFGRTGHWWAFQAHDVVPDIVTLGKPIGNGHPLGAVVTTPEIASSFANGMEYFSTFGGNPVSAAVGLAVLDVIESEGLVDSARDVGATFLQGLKELASRHDCIGDVRGRGLFLGIEFVEDRVGKSPSPAVAEYVVQRMRARNVLLSTDGPDHNVIKIKPPIVFSVEDAQRVVTEMDAILGEDYVRNG